MHAGQEAIIRVSARLWNSSLVEDYPQVSYVSIASRAMLAMAGQSLIQNRDDDVVDVVTLAYPEVTSADLKAVDPVTVVRGTFILHIELDSLHQFRVFFSPIP